MSTGKQKCARFLAGYYSAVLLTLILAGHLHRWFHYPLWLSVPLGAFILVVVPWLIVEATVAASSGSDA